MTRAEEVKAAVKANVRAVVVEKKGIETIVASKFAIAMYFDDGSHISFRTPNYDHELRMVCGEHEELVIV